MDQGELILDTLERAGEKCADPAPLVYRRLFEVHPHLEHLFVMDRDGGVRGQMLQTCINIVIGLVEKNPTHSFLIAAGRVHHDGYGVPEDQFDAMFHAMRDTFRDLLGAEWTPEADAAWGGLLEDIATIR